jgi:large conductance mechanosensitive channel
MLKEFRDFAIKGNVIDLAVAVIIGGAFGKIVASLVNDIIMPPIGYLIGGTPFTQLQYVISPGVEATETVEAIAEVAIRYGAFIQTVINFIIIAFAIFMMIKAIKSAKKKEEVKPAAPAAPAADIVLLQEIRDLLKK